MTPRDVGGLLEIDPQTLGEPRRLARSRPRSVARPRRRRPLSGRLSAQTGAAPGDAVPPGVASGPAELEQRDRWYLEQHPEVRERMWAAGARAAEEIGMTAPTGPRRVVDGEPAVLSCDIAPPSTPPSK